MTKCRQRIGEAAPMRFLQEVRLPQTCLLNQVLLWVAFQRLPVDGPPIDDSQEITDFEYEVLAGAGYAFDVIDFWHFYLEESECAVAGLPPDPRRAALLEERINWDGEGDEELKRELEDWMPRYEAAVEFPASRIFIALKEGKLAASGKLLPDPDVGKALQILEGRGEGIYELPVVAIPRRFWSLRGIDWASHAARNGQEHYCWIHFKTDDVLKTFSPEDRMPASGVERIGTNFVLSEAAENFPKSARPRGRPALPWDAFHLEVANLLLRGELPEKKESAIEHFKDWFAKNLNQRPSRTAIGAKLKPYYDRFIKSADRN
jgi:hypothetical protein